MSGRFYRNRRRNYRRRYYRRGYGSRSSRRAYGNMRAARQQADNATFTLNVPSKISTFMKTGTQLPGLAIGDTRTVGVYPLSIYELLRRNEFFNNYANMYDEFKIDKIKVKLLPTSFTINTNGNYRNLTVYTAWDRTGLNTNQLHGYYDKSRPENNAIYCTIGEDITTYSSAESRTVNPNTNTSITRWLNPKTMGEKGQWLSTSLLKQWFVGYDDENGCFKGIQFNNGDEYAAEINSTASTSNALLKFSAASKENPCYLLEDPAIKFKPTLLIGVFPAVTQAEFTQTPNRIHFNVETEIVCTYRGLRKARVISSTTEQGQNLIVAPKPTPIESNGTYYATSDGFNGYSTVTVSVPQSGGGGTTVDNANVAPNDNNIIRANGNFPIPQGKTGWNSFSVQVSGGDTPQIPSNRLAVVLDDDAITTALDRTDTFSNGVPLKNYIDWPKQGDIQWTSNVVRTIEDPNAKWVDTALIDVSNVNLAERWSQESPIGLINVLTKYKTGYNENNATYPDDYEFTTRSNIHYQNDTSKNVLVHLNNNLTNVMSSQLNVQDISNPTYADAQNPTAAEIQAEINKNPLIEPGTHAAYVETIPDPTPQNPNHKKQVIHFTFELPSGQNYKTETEGGMEIDPVLLPRLYGHSFQGHFNLPTMQTNITITQPGTYAIGNFIGDQNILEIEPINPNSTVSELPKELKLLKVGENPQENEFTLGTFTVSIPGGQDNTITKYAYTVETEDPENPMAFGPTLDLVESLEGARTVAAGQTENVEFRGYEYEDGGVTLNDAGQWACIYWNSTIYGSFIFNVDSTQTSVVQYVKIQNMTSDDTLHRLFLQISGPIEHEGEMYTITRGYFTGLCNENGEKILPLANSQEFEFMTEEGNLEIHFQISDEIDQLPDTANQKYNGQPIRRAAFTAPYNSTLYTITDTPPLTSKSSSKKLPQKSHLKTK